MNYSEVSGILFNIQRYSLHDGSGLRTTLFFKGCPLQCAWCSNPESQGKATELFIDTLHCCTCGACALSCPQKAIKKDKGIFTIYNAQCKGCNICKEVCSTGALQSYGRIWNTRDVMQVIRRDISFYRNSKGGVTLSGGEPFLQAIFAKSILAECFAEGIHTSIETCGYAQWQVIKELLPVIGTVFYDLKHIVPDIHRAGTGRSCKLILENLKKFYINHRQLIIRIPLIPKFNTSDKDVDAIAEWIRVNIPGVPVELMPYHRFGQKKYELLGRQYLYQGIKELSKEGVAKIYEQFVEKRIDCRVIN